MFDHLKLSFNVVYILLMCKIGINTKKQVEQFALMLIFFENGQDVHLLEHVR